MRRRTAGDAGAAAFIAAALCFACLPIAALAASGGKPAVLVTRFQADSLVTTSPSAARDKALAEWARRAPSGDVAWVLRRPPAALGSAELPLLDGALANLSPARISLRQRWLARRALAAPHILKKGEPPLPDLAALRPYASVYRVAALFPDAGEYAEYGRSLRATLAEGLRSGRTPEAYELQLDTLGTGDSDPARVASALEQVAGSDDVVVGELLSGPSLSLATATRLAGIVLVSPTATDERISRVGPRVFQLGPGAEARAHALADVVLGAQSHRVAIAGTLAGLHGAFAAAFASETETRGGKVVRRDLAPASASDAARFAASIKASGVDVLLWDGSSRDAEAVVRALATAGAAVRVCGGPTLIPELMHASARPLLEGVAWVDDDWRLPAATRARLDSLAAASGTRAGSLWIRGYLAGRRIAAAVDAGALTASEIADMWHVASDPPDIGGYLNVASDGATFQVYVVRGGKSVDATGDVKR